MDLNLSPSPYPLHQIYEIDHDHQLQLIPFVNSSSPPFLGSSAQDHHGAYRDHDQGLLSRQDYHYDRSDAYGSIMSKDDDCSDFKLTLSKKFEETMLENTNTATTPEKWATSDARMIHKIKNATTPVRVSIKIMRSGDKKIDEDQKLQQQSPSSNSSDIEPGNESPPHNNHMMMSPVRVCTDCYTTKTPLWRSGPKGPKSLCNACGIRQRKARRAMAAAAAASGTAITTISKQPRKMKMHCKDNKAVKNINYRNASSSPSPFKKRFKTRVAADCTVTSNVGSSSSSSDNKKKIGIEDFLMNWSNNLGLHRVFPEEEKDAAILLMAMSSGLVHG